MRQLLLSMAAALALSAQSEARTISIQSHFDKFDVQISGERASVNGKAADMSTFHDLLPLITNDLANDCSIPKGKPDVTVKDGGQTRYIYLKAGVVSDGKNCLTVGGEGLLYFPIHRDFLIGAKHSELHLKPTLIVSRQGQKLFEIVKESSGWAMKGESALLLNWDFIEKFTNSLESYDVRFRTLPAAAQDKLKVSVQSGNQTYEFYKLSDATWALKKPGQAWLEASDDWSFWYDFDDGLLADRLSEQIRAAEDTSKPLNDRLSALSKMDNSWSPNLRELFHRLVLERKTEPEIKTIAMKRLKSKPAKETAGVMAQFLSISDDDDLKRIASQILKINSPKGPLYDPQSSPAEQKKVVEYWSNWWSKNQNSH